jgi:Tn3 transposase DDE domain
VGDRARRTGQRGTLEQDPALSPVRCRGNCVVLWNIFYIDRAIAALRAAGHLIQPDDIARLSAYIRKHINVHGICSFARPADPNQPRSLRDPTYDDQNDD